MAIRHVHFEDLGVFDSVLRRRGYAISYCEAGVEDIGGLDPVSPDLIVVLGGPIEACEDAAYPFLRQELALLEPIPAGGDWPQRDLARTHYAGRFDPRQIPGLRPALRERADIAKYRSAPSPKAAAYHPGGGRVFTVSGAGNQRAAEEQALAACNSDPTRDRANGSCFLYAVGDQVILPRRLLEPLTQEPGR